MHHRLRKSDEWTVVNVLACKDGWYLGYEAFDSSHLYACVLGLHPCDQVLHL